MATIDAFVVSEISSFKFVSLATALQFWTNRIKPPTSARAENKACAFLPGPSKKCVLRSWIVAVNFSSLSTLVNAVISSLEFFKEAQRSWYWISCRMSSWESGLVVGLPGKCETRECIVAVVPPCRDEVGDLELIAGCGKLTHFSSLPRPRAKRYMAYRFGGNRMRRGRMISRYSTN